jgi:hypothetical protein
VEVDPEQHEGQRKTASKAESNSRKVSIFSK